MLMLRSASRCASRSRSSTSSLTFQAPARSFALDAKLVDKASFNYSQIQGNLIKRIGISHSNPTEARELFDKITADPNFRSQHVAEAIFQVYLQNLDKAKANEILLLLGRYSCRQPQHYHHYFFYFYHQIDQAEKLDLEKRIFADIPFWKTQDVSDKSINVLYRYLYLKEQSVHTITSVMEEQGGAEKIIEPMHNFVSHLESKQKGLISREALKLSGLKDDKSLQDQLKAMTSEQFEAVVSKAKEASPENAAAFLAYKGQLAGNDLLSSDAKDESEEAEGRDSSPFSFKTSYKDLKSPLDIVNYH